MRGYCPRYFKAYELFPPEMLTKYNEDFLWRLMDDRILITADRVRERYGKMVANTWYWGGTHCERGFRLFSTITGAAWSDHKFGRAVDLVPMLVTVEEIREDILKAKEVAQSSRSLKHVFEHVTAMEVNIPWLHIASRNFIGLQIIRPAI